MKPVFMRVPMWTPDASRTSLGSRSSSSPPDPPPHLVVPENLVYNLDVGEEHPPAAVPVDAEVV